MSLERSVALILAPSGRDAAILEGLIEQTGFAAQSCATVDDLGNAISDDTTFIVLAEEAVRHASLHGLASSIEQQPAWSDLPFIVLTQRGGGPERNPFASRLQDVLGKVIFVERPFHPMTLISAVRTAGRGRKRQYQARALLQDLSEREDALREAVEARDLLILEVNHRVKNSLQLVSSIINLQAQSASDETRQSLRIAGARINAIAAIHSSLYEDGDIQNVELDRYLERICRNLAAAAGGDLRGIEVVVDAEPLRLETNKAISLSLAINELVTNAFKHAFAEGEKGTVKIELRVADQACLTISDEGGRTGATATACSGKRTGLGTRLIEGAVTQLNGKLRQTRSTTGWTTSITFPV